MCGCENANHYISSTTFLISFFTNYCSIMTEQDTSETGTETRRSVTDTVGVSTTGLPDATAKRLFDSTPSHEGYGRKRKTQTARIRQRIRQHDEMMIKRGFLSDNDSDSEHEQEKLHESDRILEHDSAPEADRVLEHDSASESEHDSQHKNSTNNILDDHHFDSTKTCSFFGTTRHIHHFYKVLKAIDPFQFQKSKPSSTSKDFNADFNDFHGNQNAVLGDPLNLATNTSAPEPQPSKGIVNIKITDEGMVFSIGKAHTGMSGFFVDRPIFSEFFLDPGRNETSSDDRSDNQNNQSNEENSTSNKIAYRFALPLQPLLDCLKIMASNELPKKSHTDRAQDSGSDSDQDEYGLRRTGFSVPSKKPQFRKTKLVYVSEGTQRFLLIFEGHHSTKTVCEFKVMVSDDDEEHGFDATRVALKAIFKGPMLGRALKTFISVDTEKLMIRGVSWKKRLEFVSEGSMGISAYTFPKDAEDFESLKVVAVEPDWDEVDVSESEQEYNDEEDDDDDDDDIFVKHVVQDGNGNRVVDPAHETAKLKRKQARQIHHQKKREERHAAKRAAKLSLMKQEFEQTKRKVSVEHTYLFNQVAMALMGVTIGSKQNVRCDWRGFMNIQSMYRLEPRNPESKLHIYMDYRFSPEAM